MQLQRYLTIFLILTVTAGCKKKEVPLNHIGIEPEQRYKLEQSNNRCRDTVTGRFVPTNLCD